MADTLGCEDADVAEAARFLSLALAGMGDDAQVTAVGTGTSAQVRQTGLRIVRGIEGDRRATILACWTELWRGAIHAQRAFMDIDVECTGDALLWTIAPREETGVG